MAAAQSMRDSESKPTQERDVLARGSEGIPLEPPRGFGRCPMYLDDTKPTVDAELEVEISARRRRSSRLRCTASQYPGVRVARRCPERTARLGPRDQRCAPATGGRRGAIATVRDWRRDQRVERPTA